MKRPASRILAASCAPRGRTCSRIVGKRGAWKTVILKNKTKEQRWEQRELQGPVAWRTYSKVTASGATVRIETNVRFIRRIWRRAVGDTGVGVECDGVEIKPWVAIRRQRADLRVDLPGVARNVYWHDALWYFFHNHGKFQCWSAFVKSLRAPNGHRVDHVGGNPAVVCLEKLRLQSSRLSRRQSGPAQKLYRQEGTTYWTQRRLSCD